MGGKTKRKIMKKPKAKISEQYIFRACEERQRKRKENTKAQIS